MPGQKNAIERRLEELESQWNEFAVDPAARLLRWVVDGDDAQMVDVFLDVQNEEGSQVPDLFVRLGEPFDDATVHGAVLAASLAKQYEEIRAGLRGEGIDADWRAPARVASEDGARYFVRCAASLADHYPDLLQKLALVLFPSRVTSRDAWRAWLDGLLSQTIPERVRFVVLDSLESPALEALAVDHGALVKTRNAELDMPAARLDLAKGATDKGPGYTFRLYFVALTNAAGAKDVAGAKRAGANALAIAEEHGWLPMQFTIHAALASVHLSAKEPSEALERYRRAGAAAQAATEAGDPVGKKLLVQARMGEGAVLVSMKNWREAAPVYESAAEIAETLEDALLSLEGWRMAAWCHEHAKAYEPAWKAATRAIDAAERMDEAARKLSTLPWAGDVLVRVATRIGAEEAKRARARLEALAGPQWREPVEKVGREAKALAAEAAR